MNNLFNPEKVVYGYASHVEALINNEISENVLATISSWAKIAKVQDWSDGDIETVKTKALSSNYDNLLETILTHSDY